MDTVNIILLYNHQLVREAWAFMLNSIPGYRVVGGTDDAKEGMKLAQKHKPHVIIIGTEFNQNGFDMTEKVAQELPGSAIIGISPSNLPAYVRRMMKAGALGFVTKSSPGEELIKAVEAVRYGKEFLCREVDEIIKNQTIAESSLKTPQAKALSGRELDIMGLIRDGLSSKEIARKLTITEKTVQVHRYNILKKLKLKNAAALVNYMNSHFIS